MAKGSKRSNGRDATPSGLTARLRSHPSLPVIRLTENLKAPASGPARLFSGAPATITVKAPATKGDLKRSKNRQVPPFQIAFSAPKETVVCVRRSRRREVLHALKKTGKRGQRKPRRSSWRNYRC